MWRIAWRPRVCLPEVRFGTQRAALLAWPQHDVMLAVTLWLAASVGAFHPRGGAMVTAWEGSHGTAMSFKYGRIVGFSLDAGIRALSPAINGVSATPL